MTLKTTTSPDGIYTGRPSILLEIRIRRLSQLIVHVLEEFRLQRRNGHIGIRHWPAAWSRRLELARSVAELQGRIRVSCAW